MDYKIDEYLDNWEWEQQKSCATWEEWAVQVGEVNGMDQYGNYY